MTLPIIKAGELPPVNSCIIGLYGPPGVGKTTIACTADHPLHLSFDSYGLERSLMGGAVDSIPMFQRGVPIMTVAELATLPQRIAEEGYKNIIIDTIGGCQDWIFSQLPANYREANGASPNIKGWGWIKEAFRPFWTGLANSGVSVIVIAHSKTDKTQRSGEKSVVFMDMMPMFAQTVIPKMAQVGLVMQMGQTRTIDFVAYGNDAKDTARVGLWTLPDISGGVDKSNSMQTLIDRTIAAINENIASSKATAEEQKEMLEALNAAVSELQVMEVAQVYADKMPARVWNSLVAARIRDIHKLQLALVTTAREVNFAASIMVGLPQAIKDLVRGELGSAYAETATRLKLTYDKTRGEYTGPDTDQPQTALPL